MVKKSSWVLLLLSCAIFSPATYGQGVEVEGGFVQDSIAIGEPAHYFLIARYPSPLTLLFPDSTFQFAPFEFSRKKYFVTVSHEGFSYDSVVYQLRTFEIESIQTLTLPIFVVAKPDCIRYEPLRDTLYLKTLVKHLPPDSLQAQDLPLKTNTEYKAVAFLFNYPVVVIIVASLLLISLFVWIFFGKKIRKHFRVKRLQQEHVRFISTFSQQLAQLERLFSPQLTESALSLWKKYLEKLEQKPFTKLTTRETIQLEHDEQLGVVLKALDRAIYGNTPGVLEPLERLRDVANIRFQKKLDTVRHG